MKIKLYITYLLAKYNQACLYEVFMDIWPNNDKVWKKCTSKDLWKFQPELIFLSFCIKKKFEVEVSVPNSKCILLSSLLFAGNG